MRDLGYVPSEVDPCLLVKRNKKNEIAYVAIYVDDCLFIGSENLIQETIKGIVK